jgi:hypothetical protein
MKKIIVFTAAGMLVLLGLMTSGCDQKKAEEPTKSEQTTTAPAPVKKAPKGC